MWNRPQHLRREYAPLELQVRLDPGARLEKIPPWQTRARRRGREPPAGRLRRRPADPAGRALRRRAQAGRAPNRLALRAGLRWNAGEGARGIGAGRTPGAALGASLPEPSEPHHHLGVRDGVGHVGPRHVGLHPVHRGIPAQQDQRALSDPPGSGGAGTGRLVRPASGRHRDLRRQRHGVGESQRPPRRPRGGAQVPELRERGLPAVPVAVRARRGRQDRGARRRGGPAPGGRARASRRDPRGPAGRGSAPGRRAVAGDLRSGARGRPGDRDVPRAASPAIDRAHARRGRRARRDGPPVRGRPGLGGPRGARGAGAGLALRPRTSRSRERSPGRGLRRLDRAARRGLRAAPVPIRLDPRAGGVLRRGVRTGRLRDPQDSV
jgi:hypothetical protein